MILTISTTHQPATDLGYLLHKNPARMHSLDLGFGMAHVVYPEATEERCTAALMLEIDPVALVRTRQGPDGEGGLMRQYVNDRPYAASSFLGTAINRVLGTALGGRSKDRPELAQTEIPLEVRIPVLPARGGASFVRNLFEPLGYQVEAKTLPLDETFPAWGDSSYVDLTLRCEKRLSDVLTHLYVLIPVLDNAKHYWIDEDEIDKLLRHGEKWLNDHPLKEGIVRRYLRNRRVLTRLALARLTEQDGDPEPDEAEAEAAEERRQSLHEIRLESVVEALRETGASSVLDLGCGEGRLLSLLVKEKQFGQILGMDVSYSVLDRALHRLERMPRMKAERVKLIHGSLMYRDKRLAGFDAAAVVEVIEHLDAPRLASFERVLFEFAQPKHVVLTTPNREYNSVFGMEEGTMRHKDHRFEWTRAEFQTWCEAVGERFGYDFEIAPIGPIDETHGAPSQMATFRLR